MRLPIAEHVDDQHVDTEQPLLQARQLARISGFEQLAHEIRSSREEHRGAARPRATSIECIATRRGSSPPDVAEPRQGWYASGQTGYPHWMYFLFD